MFHSFEGDCFQLGDATLHYEVIGNPTGEPLLLLHGGLGSMADFNGIVEELGKTYRLIGIDFRGHGQSTLGSEKLTYSQYMTDVEAILDHIGLHKVSVLGFSDGGIVGYRLAVSSPARVRALVTVGAAWRLEPDDPVTATLAGVTAEAWRARFADSVRYYESVNPQPDFERLVKAAVSLWTDPTESGYPGETVSKIQVPTLVVRGDNDWLFPLEEAAQLRLRLGPSSLLNIPLAGQAAHDDARTLFLLAVAEFLREPDRAVNRNE